MHEAQMHEFNSFITLTYNDEHLPPDGSLKKKHYQDFMKRLRRKYDGMKIRFFHCGEYGDKDARPHYHAILFGIDWPDRKLFTIRKGIPTYTSQALEDLWQKGFCTVGDVTFESAAYVARYVMKKVTGDRAAEHYQSVNALTGELHQIAPEYITMSTKPGVGHAWYKKFFSDIYPRDFTVTNGKEGAVPRYYDKLLEREQEKLLQQLKHKRVLRANEHAIDNTPERMRVREEVKQARIRLLKRDI